MPPAWAFDSLPAPKEHIYRKTVPEHVRNKFDAFSKAAGIFGALHDLGKYTLPFLHRLDGSGEPVDHSIAGAQAVIRVRKVFILPARAAGGKKKTAE
jgi:hypothetical protein